MGWYKDANGKPVWVDDAPASPRGTPIGMQDPTMPYKAQGAALDNAGKAADIRNDSARIALERQRLELARQAQARADAAANDARQVNQRDRDGRLAKLRALENQIGTVRGLYKTGPGSTKGVMGALDYLPTPRNKAFDSAGAGLGEIGLSAFRVPGVGAQSDAELRAFVEANRPSSSDYDEQIEQKLSNLENRLTEEYRSYGVQYPRKPSPRKPGLSGAPRKNDGWKIERLD